MTSHGNQAVTAYDTEIAIARTTRGRWLRWTVWAVLLLLVGGIALYEIQQHHITRLEQATEQIQLGSDWKKVWTADQDLWGSPAFISEGIPSNGTQEFIYGGPTSRIGTHIGWNLPYWDFVQRRSEGLRLRAQCPVGIVVDQNGHGKVVGVLIRDKCRGFRPVGRQRVRPGNAILSNPAVRPLSPPR